MNQMKCSISMSSLDSNSKFLKTPESLKKSEFDSRLCYSLNSKKPRRTLDKKMWRRSWGSSEEANQEEFWKTCMQTFQELPNGNSEEKDLKDFLEDYSKASEWLNSVQLERSRFADAKELSLLANDLLDKKSWRTEINEKATVLIRKLPKLKEEFHWRVKHLNSQWDALEKILSCQSSTSSYSMPAVPDKDNCDIEWVHNWLKEKEKELQPLDFRAQWSTQQLQDEMLRYQALQAEIEANASVVHAALRQCQSQGRASDVKSKRRIESLKKRWLQLRLRIVEWDQYLSQVQERQKYQYKGKRSDICASSWESDEDNNEPRKKYRRLGDSPLQNIQEQRKNQIIVVVRGSERFVPDILDQQSVSSISHCEQFLEKDNGASVTDTTKNGVHEYCWVMGQSHDTEGDYNQSDSPVPNSVVESNFDGSLSVGMERSKLSPSISPPLTSIQYLQHEQVVPKNISTYYFKHSDTEPELNQNNIFEYNESVERLCSTVETSSHIINQLDIRAVNDSTACNKPVIICQKSRVALDFSQEFEVDGKSVNSCDDISFSSWDLDLDMEEHQDQDMMEIGGNEEQDQLVENNSSHLLPKLDEIEELVQNAELLVVKLSRSRRGVECVNLPVESASSDEDEEEEEDRLEEKNNKLIVPHGAVNDEGNPVATLMHLPQTTFTSTPIKTAVSASTIGYPLRKCSGSNSVTTPSSNAPLANMKSATITMDVTNPVGAIVVLEGESVLLSPSQSAATTATSTTTNTTISKTSKKSSRVRQWIRAHNNTDIVVDQKNTSSCDASAESTSDSESSSSESGHPLSSDDPTTVSASTFLYQTHAVLAESGAFSHGAVKASSSCSSTNNVATGSVTNPSGVSTTRQRSPPASTSGAVGPVVWRTKKRSAFVKQRPKSFTDTLVGSGGSNSQSAGQSSWISSSHNPSFVSDTALNRFSSQSQSQSQSQSASCSWSSSGGGGSPGQSNTDTLRDKKKGKFKRKFSKSKRKSVEEIDENNCRFVKSTSFCESGVKSSESLEHPRGIVEEKNDSENRPPRAFLPSPGYKKPGFARLNSDNGSVNTVEDFQTGVHDQDWDSYQEKYNSEPYSEEPYDPDGTLKLLSFGEDYGKYLDRADSECSSILSGFEPNPRKRRPLMLVNRNEMPESDSDREELNHLLSQSASQLRFIDMVFKKQIIASTNLETESPAEHAEMEATCEENINSLKLILSNIDKPDTLPFEIDIKSIKDVLESWHVLKEKITQAAKLQQIQEEMDLLKKDFSNVQSHFGDVDPFDSSNLSSLQDKISHIQRVLYDLSERKQKLQGLNEASLGTQTFLKDTDIVGDIKEQLQELYSLYEDNFQLGSYLLEKMRFLQEAWEKFENEKSEFEKSISLNSLRPKLRKELSSAASSDSGHGTDFSHSDSDMDFQERRQKLAALRKRACDLKAFLPPGSPVLDVIDQKINEAQRGFEAMRTSYQQYEPLDLKIIYPKKRSPIISKRSPTGEKVTRQMTSTIPQQVSRELSPVKPHPSSNKSRKWRIVRLTLSFHLALMGLLAAAYLLQPKCCEFSNTFCFSFVPHLTHESLPPI